MDSTLNNKKELTESQMFPIEKYNFSHFSENNCVAFSGSAINHPYEDDKFILIRDPLSDHTEFIEFLKSDVLHIKELPSLLSSSGENINMSIFWIKLGVKAIKYEPFIVAKTKNFITNRVKSK